VGDLGVGRSRRLAKRSQVAADLNSLNCVFTDRSCVGYHRYCEMASKKYIPGHAFPSNAPQVNLDGHLSILASTLRTEYIYGNMALLLEKYLLIGRRENPRCPSMKCSEVRELESNTEKLRGARSLIMWKDATTVSRRQMAARAVARLASPENSGAARAQEGYFMNAAKNGAQFPILIEWQECGQRGWSGVELSQCAPRFAVDAAASLKISMPLLDVGGKNIFSVVNEPVAGPSEGSTGAASPQSTPRRAPADK